jgi:hypothetical protein
MIRGKPFPTRIRIDFVAGQPVLAGTKDQPGKHDAAEGVAAGAVAARPLSRFTNPALLQVVFGDLKALGIRRKA